ncbi:MAG: AraC family transcriptional regulator [Gemmatimonadetes bacterium]|nr:AraC family transcriptional regulator [Gemmatimonadota bacterium]
MDVLSDILATLRLRGTLYFSTEFRRPWGLRVPKHGRVARFHLVVRGGCWVRVEGAEGGPVFLESGDLMLIPSGSEHVLADTPDTPCRTVDEVVRAAGFTGRGALLHGGEDTGAPTRLICGHFEFDEGMDHPLLEQLPPSLVVRWDEEVRDSPMEDAFRFIAREVQDARPGHAAVVGRLSEVLFVQVVRFWADRTRPDHGVLAAMADPRLGEALAAMHTTPADAWTLERLARVAALSRTSFAERFRSVVGLTPLQYLTHWRMQLARRWLAESRLSLEAIAGRVGYDSAASFSRAFRKATGGSPGAWRREARNQRAEQIREGNGGA